MTKRKAKITEANLEALHASVQALVKQINQTVDAYLEQIEQADDALTMDDVDARNAAYALGPMDLYVEMIRAEIASTTGRSKELEELIKKRLCQLMTAAELPDFTVTKPVRKKFFPAQALYLSLAEGMEYSSPELHEALRAYGVGGIIKTGPAAGSLKSAYTELKKKYGEFDAIPPIEVPILNIHGDPIFDPGTGEVATKTIDIEKLVKAYERPSVRVVKA